MSDEAKKQKCAVPGCGSEATYCYHGGHSHYLCENHETALDRWYPTLAAKVTSDEADDLAEATLAAIHAGMAEIGDYMAARKQARMADDLVGRHIEDWIRSQGTKG